MPLSEEVRALFDDADPKVKEKLTALATKVEVAFDASEAEFAKNKSRVNKENELLRKSKIAFEKVAKETGIEGTDASEVAELLLTKFKGNSEKTGTFEQQLKIIQQQLADQKNETTIAKKRALESSLKAKTLIDFQKFMQAPTLHLNNAIAEGLTLADDGETPIWKDGEEIIDYVKGMANYVSRHKDDAKNLQQPGAQTTKGRQSSSKTENSITSTEYDSMSPIQKAKWGKEHPGATVIPT